MPRSSDDSSFNINPSLGQLNLFFEKQRDFKHEIGVGANNWKVEILVNYGEDPRVTEIFDRIITPGMLYNVFDTTCHIMAELIGNEKNGIFPAETIDSLAKKAYQISADELRALQAPVTEESITAMAMWNLLLPEQQGGVWPNEVYDTFIGNLTAILQRYKTSSEKKINFITFDSVIMNECFPQFKKLVELYYKLENRPKVDLIP